MRASTWSCTQSSSRRAHRRGRAQRTRGARCAAWGQQRVHRALRRPGAGGRAPRAHGGRARASRGSLVLPRLARGVLGRLGRAGPAARSVPRRRGAPAARRGGSCPTRGVGTPHRASQARGAMIRLENLTKHYGAFVAVDDISLAVPRGLLYGWLRPDDAGKTTMLRMIAGILRPTDGRVFLGGDDVHRNAIAAKLKLGFIPDRPFVNAQLTGAEFLRFVAGLYGQEGEAI